MLGSRVWSRIFAAIVGLALMSGLAVGVTISSGGTFTCPPHWRLDAQGHEWPVLVKVTQPPVHGTISTRIMPQSVIFHGQPRTVHATLVTYHPRPGYIGEDSFTYLRTTNDPTDPNKAPITVSVTTR